jgi:hypothetical protein
MFAAMAAGADLRACPGQFLSRELRIWRASASRFAVVKTLIAGL